MRKSLKKLNGQRMAFTGTFERFGTKPGWVGTEETILLVDIRDTEDNPITDHLWFNLTKGFQALNLQPGDKVEFQARVRKYQKGYKGYRFEAMLDSPVSTDYKLSHPTAIRKLSEDMQEAVSGVGRGCSEDNKSLSCSSEEESPTQIKGLQVWHGSKGYWNPRFGKLGNEPDGWCYVPAGYAALTRAIREGAHWIVLENSGNHAIKIGTVAPSYIVNKARERLNSSTAQKRREARERRVEYMKARFAEMMRKK